MVVRNPQDVLGSVALRLNEDCSEIPARRNVPCRVLDRTAGGPEPVLLGARHCQCVSHLVPVLVELIVGQRSNPIDGASQCGAEGWSARYEGVLEF